MAQRYTTELIEAVREAYNANPKAFAGLDGPGPITDDDCEQLLDSGYLPYRPCRIDNCPHCGLKMDVGDLDPNYADDGVQCMDCLAH